VFKDKKPRKTKNVVDWEKEKWLGLRETIILLIKLKWWWYGSRLFVLLNQYLFAMTFQGQAVYGGSNSTN